MSVPRRRATSALVALLVLLTAGATPVLAAPASANAPDAVASDPALSQQEPTIDQRIVVDKNPDPGSVTMTFEYRLPSGVTDLLVDVPVLARDGVTVESTDGFERVTQSGFEWDGDTDVPSVSVRFSVGDSFARDVRGIERDDWAFVVEPNTNVRWRGTPDNVTTTMTVGGEGYASSHMAFAGAHERRTVQVADERATFVLGRPGTNVTGAVDFLRLANEHFDFGVRHEEVTVFVLPLSEREVQHVTGATIDTAFWVTQPGVELTDTGAVFTHEYVHTRLGGVGTRGSTWLTEGSAEYYGRVFALNAGVGDYDAYLDGLRAEQYDPDRTSVVLTNPQTWAGTTAHYSKGAHVLAALDAEIQRQTGGRKSLRDVFEAHPEPFDGYESFRATVVEVSGDDSLGPWLDRYVAGDDLPPIPDDPRYYVAEPTLDPDEDGLTSGVETDGGTNPFVADTDGDGVVDGADESPLEAATATPTSTTTVQEARDETRTGTGTETGTKTVTGTPTGPTDSPTGTRGSAPGFGVVVATVALLCCGRVLR